jgi:hypothetical protein
MLEKLLAQCDPIIGCISPPVAIANMGLGVDPTGKMPGVIVLLNTLLRVVFIVAGIWALFNFMMAGFDYMGASGDPKKITAAWQKIWMSVLGLALVVASFLLAAIVGIIIFKDPFAILNPTLSR